MHQLELKVALDAVRRASRLAMRVRFPSSSTLVDIPAQAAADSSPVEAISKEDQSPVTVADLGAQAVVNTVLKQHFPNDPIVGEEDAQVLREQPLLRQQVFQLANAALQSSPLDGSSTGGGFSMEHLLAMIDAGRAEGGPSGRFWALDPIDGTKGFLRGEQFAICLALIVDGQVQLGVLGCPNLALPAPSTASPGRGMLFAAVRGQGAFQLPLEHSLVSEAPRQPIHVRPFRSLSACIFCESVESAHSDQSQSAQIAKRLRITAAPLRMDSQCKYAALACGHADIYLRLPISGKKYTEKIWDHAAGDLLVREAGGCVTDMDGKPLDFGRGRLLAGNRGVIASSDKQVHENVLAAVKETIMG